MRVLVTGANGFVGRHVLREFKAGGHDPVALVYEFADRELPDGSQFIEAAVTDAAAVERAVKSFQPDACIHLAGVSFVPDGQAAPSSMYQVNTVGTACILHALATSAPAARVLTVSTAQVYGGKVRRKPVTEDEPLTPANHYGISKAAADLMTLAYARTHGMHAMTVRPYNHVGPGQSPKFVVASLARQLKEIGEGRRENKLTVGNMESARDFTDVRDVARAYRLLIEKGTGGEAYNIASGRIVPIGTVLNLLSELAGVEPEIEVSQSLFRPTDTAAELDIGKIRKHTGWQPEISLEQSLRDIWESMG